MADGRLANMDVYPGKSSTSCAPGGAYFPEILGIRSPLSVNFWYRIKAGATKREPRQNFEESD